MDLVRHCFESCLEINDVFVHVDYSVNLTPQFIHLCRQFGFLVPESVSNLAHAVIGALLDSLANDEMTMPLDSVFYRVLATFSVSINI